MSDRPHAPDGGFRLSYLDEGRRVGLDCEVHRVTIDAPDPAAGVPFATVFRLPMKDLDKAWYEATRVFGPYNGHPEFCEDWNLESGGDTDFGEPLVAPWSGVVINAFDAGGRWGMILRILGVTPKGQMVTWMGAHLASIYVKVGEIVQVGDRTGAVGNAGGRYSTHLHEQVCVGAVPGPTVFGTDRRYDFRQPSRFYQQHGVDADLIARVTERDGG